MATFEITLAMLPVVAFVGVLARFEIPDVMRRLSVTPWHELALHAVVVWAAVNLVRIAWVFPGANLRALLFRKVREREGMPNPREVFIVGWAGLRGSVTMAAALSIPLVIGNATPFPGRDLLVFLAATTILLTLLVNGLTLPMIIRFLGVQGDGLAAREQRAARIALAQAGSSALRQALSRLTRPEEIAVARHLAGNYERLLLRLSSNAARRVDLDALANVARQLIIGALEAERAELVEMRNAGVINDETMRAIEAEIDDSEASLGPAATHVRA